MRRLLLAALGAAVLAAGAVPASAASSGSTKRVLVIFSDAGDPDLKTQTALLMAVPASELRERDLVVLHVLPDGRTSVLFGDAGAAYPAERLRRDRDGGFTAVLVGKDGGVKWREKRPARPDELFGLIDSMPMRKLEMKRNRPAG